MARTLDADVLVVGAGPVGLFLSCLLSRQGVSVRVIEKQAAPSRLLRAVGVASRTLELFADLGVLEAALDAGVVAKASRVFWNGSEVACYRLGEFQAPYPLELHLAQDQTERILRDKLSEWDVNVEWNRELVGLTQSEDGVTAQIRNGDATTSDHRFLYVVGCDGARSATRRAIGVSFDGETYPVDLLLADAIWDWDLPHDGIARFVGDSGLLVAVTVKDEGRFRVSGPLATMHADNDDIVLDEPTTLVDDRPPASIEQIEEFVAVRSGQKATIRKLIWTSHFRIGLRQASRYRVGRVFLAGDAAHIHPPTGGQGMNMGLQDAYNLAWKLHLATIEKAAPGLLDSYHEERHPVGRETIERTRAATVRAMGPTAEPAAERQAELVNSMLFVNYRGSPIVGPTKSALEPTIEGGDPRPGDRAPDAKVWDVKRRQWTSLFRHYQDNAHIIVEQIQSDGMECLRQHMEFAERSRRAAREVGEWIWLVPAKHPLSKIRLGHTILEDREGAFARAYGNDQVYVIRPDGHLGYRGHFDDVDALASYLGKTYRCD